MEHSKTYPMTGGDGPFSYLRNSSTQKAAADAAAELLHAAILENLDIDCHSTSLKPFIIVDLGCSVGPNTFTAVNNIIEAVKHKADGSSIPAPEFQVYFNDHISNDFNTLFLNLPRDRNYYAAAMPGSFHARLFPKNSLNFAYSANSLHWLSEVPIELLDASSPALNKGRIFYSKAPREVVDAYSAQFARDMESFLAARAEELASGGLVAILLSGRREGMLAMDSVKSNVQPLEAALLDMATEGRLVSQAKVDAFNLPIYNPSVDEMRALVQRNGCFDVMRMETVERRNNPKRLTAAEGRAAMEVMLTKHFGVEAVEEVFKRYADKVGAQPELSASEIQKDTTGLFVLLKRKH